MRLPTKLQFEAKLMDYPLLRQLWFERWFRIAFALFACVFLFLGAFLPRIWRTSPPGFLPIVRVSGLDLMQAWSLKRTALKAASAGKFDEANYAWQAAIANNRADLNLLRGALRCILKDPTRTPRAGQAIQESFWLLRLTKTNLTDLELAADVLEQFHHPERVLELVEPRLKEITPALSASYLKALFNSGRVDLIQKRWAELEKQLPADPQLPLYHAAASTGWGPSEVAAQGREQLEAAMRDPALRVLACRLKLAVSGHQLDASGFGEALHKLEDWREDTVQNHAAYWRLLVINGRKSEALELSKVFTRPPASPVEAVELSQAYAELDRPDEALGLLERYLKDFSYAPIYWITYAGAIIQSKRWEQLRQLSIQMRSESTVRDSLLGMSYFLEGRAELGLNRLSTAATAFGKAAECEFPYAALGQRVAEQLLQFGYPELARRILTPLEKTLQGQPSYWLVAFSAADRLKDVDLLLKAATQAYRLTPGDPMVVNNYAAALLINRQSPDEVIKITLPLFQQNPNSLHAVVNHSAALLLNDRAQEAEAILSRVRTNSLTPLQLALYNLDLFETYLSLGKEDLARAASDRIELDRLYPTQVKWLQEARRRLPPPKTDSSPKPSVPASGG